MREDLCSHVIFHFRAHDMTIIGDIVVRKKLNNDEHYQDAPDHEDLLHARFRRHIRDRRSDIPYRERDHQSYR